ncbi:Predicted membrane protein [Seinonella peptonophila]|uniref:Predicted membrane protein n=1 Tax=Seinonella peptonophila TaxID=112248 RepID=A0A1M4XKR9_9BACL|nr:cell wall-active antibiotics response protein LiaF [Seinonella peptonophila]SHE94031.1 Predicted membrane protein [Seinonella peptonophila]
MNYSRYFFFLLIGAFSSLVYLFTEDYYVSTLILILPISIFLFIGRYYLAAIISITLLILIYFQLILPVIQICVAIMFIYYGFQLLCYKNHAQKNHTWFGKVDPLQTPRRLDHAHLFCGVGLINLNLHQAILLNGENRIIIQSWFGQTRIFVPADLTISISAVGLFGKMDFFGEVKRFPSPIQVSSKNDPHSAQKISISILYLIGEIEVIQQ